MQLQCYLFVTDCPDPSESGFYPSYGIETALFVLFDYLCQVADRGAFETLSGFQCYQPYCLSGVTGWNEAMFGIISNPTYFRDHGRWSQVTIAILLFPLDYWVLQSPGVPCTLVSTGNYWMKGPRNV